jgi:vacuole morphology and inheritance protein 14
MISTNFYISSAISPLTTRSKIGRDEIKWQELLLHFRSVQSKHEKARRQALGNDTSPIIGFPDEKGNETSDRVGRPGSGRILLRRRATGEISEPISVPQSPQASSRSGVLSPLNPKARAPSGLTGLIGANSGGKLSPSLNSTMGQAQKQRRPLEPTRK